MSGDVKVNCPRCTQRLSVPTHDFSLQVACQRCGTTHIVGALVGTDRTVMAMPLFSSTSSPGTVAAAAGVVRSPTPGPAAAPAYVQQAVAPAVIPPGTLPRPASAAPERTVDDDAGRGLVETIDDVLRGKRRFVLGAAAVFAIFFGWFVAWVFENAIIELFLLGLTTLIVPATGTVLLVLQVAAARDDDGAIRWSELIGLWAAGIRAGLQGSSEAFGYLFSANAAERWRIGSSGSFIVALSLLSMHPFLPLILALAELAGLDREVRTDISWVLDGGMTFFVVCCLVAGVAFRFLSSSAARELGRARGVRVGAPGADLAAFRNLPPQIDLVRDRAAGAALAARIDRSMVAEVITALAAWRPRSAYRSEYEYQESLRRHLVRTMPYARTRKEWQLGGYRGRVDLRVEDVNVELKRTLDDANGSRTVDQIDKYLGRGNGTLEPTLIVVCETPPDFHHSRIADVIRRARTAGDPVTLIAAGRAVA